MKYIVYCTRNTKNSKIYIGVHKTLTPFEFDGYLGNGITVHNKSIKPTTAFQTAVKKYGCDSFIRTTLAVFNTEEEAYSLEAILVNADFIKRKDTYNMVLGGKSADWDILLRPVVQYNLEGKLLNRFDTISIAADTITAKPFDINKACIDHSISCKGYFWRYYTGTNEIISIPTSIQEITRSLPVVQYSKVGYKIKEWNTISEAAKSLHIDKSSISGVCKGYKGRKLAGGYQWRYKTDNLQSLDSIETSGGTVKKILQLDSNNVLLAIHDSITIAEQLSGVSRKSIHKGLATGNVVASFRWEYA